MTVNDNTKEAEGLRHFFEIIGKLLQKQVKN